MDLHGYAEYVIYLREAAWMYILSTVVRFHLNSYRSIDNGSIEHRVTTKWQQLLACAIGFVTCPIWSNFLSKLWNIGRNFLTFPLFLITIYGENYHSSNSELEPVLSNPTALTPSAPPPVPPPPPQWTTTTDTTTTTTTTTSNNNNNNNNSTNNIKKHFFHIIKTVNKW